MLFNQAYSLKNWKLKQNGEKLANANKIIKKQTNEIPKAFSFIFEGKKKIKKQEKKSNKQMVNNKLE